MYQYPLVAINMSNNSNKSQVSQSEVVVIVMYIRGLFAEYVACCSHKLIRNRLNIYQILLTN